MIISVEEIINKVSSMSTKLKAEIGNKKIGKIPFSLPS